MKIKRNNKLLLTFLAVFIISAGFLFFEANYIFAEGVLGTTDQQDLEQSEIALADAQKGGFFVDILLAVLKFVGWILNLAVILFAKIADASTMRTILTDPSILTAWGLVRDICNIGFILILLFSAFSTVFQYSKYNYKNILMWLVIMALLVNFSFPIARFVIDVSNVLMYTIFNNLMGEFASKEGLGKIFTSDSSAFGSLQVIMTDTSGGVPQLLASIIFVFVLALTILAIAIILLIRIVALAIIIILSPVGFVGTIIGKDGGWWSNLFKYSMAGPIIAFVLYLSTTLMTAMGKATADVGTTFGGVEAPNSIVIGMTKFIAPIVILWMGMAMAVKGIDGSGAIIGKMQGIAKGAGKKFSGYNFAKGQYGAFAASRKKRRDEMDKKKFGGSVGDRANDAQDRALATIGSEKAKGRYNKRKEQGNKDDIKSKSEKHDGTSTTDLHSAITGNITTPINPNDKNAKIEAAGKVRQMLSRGKEFEDSISNMSRAEKVNVLNSMGVSTADQAAIINNGKEFKRRYMAEARKLIKNAEDHGKLK